MIINLVAIGYKARLLTTSVCFRWENTCFHTRRIIHYLVGFSFVLTCAVLFPRGSERNWVWLIKFVWSVRIPFLIIIVDSTLIPFKSIKDLFTRGLIRTLLQFAAQATGKLPWVLCVINQASVHMPGQYAGATTQLIEHKSATADIDPSRHHLVYPLPTF